jgi:hypothetical protein
MVLFPEIARFGYKLRMGARKKFTPPDSRVLVGLLENAGWFPGVVYLIDSRYDEKKPVRIRSLQKWQHHDNPYFIVDLSYYEWWIHPISVEDTNIYYPNIGTKIWEREHSSYNPPLANRLPDVSTLDAILSGPWPEAKWSKWQKQQIAEAGDTEIKHNATEFLEDEPADFSGHEGWG